MYTESQPRGSKLKADSLRHLRASLKGRNHLGIPLRIYQMLAAAVLGSSFKHEDTGAGALESSHQPQCQGGYPPTSRSAPASRVLRPCSQLPQEPANFTSRPGTELTPRLCIQLPWDLDLPTSRSARSLSRCMLQPATLAPNFTNQLAESHHQRQELIANQAGVKHHPVVFTYQFVLAQQRAQGTLTRGAPLEHTALVTTA